jgi:ATP-binding cassette subfamily B protein
MDTIPNSVAKFLWHFMCKQRFKFFILLIASTTWGIATSLWPLLIENLIDALGEFTDDRSLVFQTMSGPILSALFFWVFLEFMARARGFSFAAVMPKAEAMMRMETFRYVSKHSHSYFSKEFTGSLANKIGDIPRGAYLITDIVFFNIVPTLIAITISLSLFSRLNTTLVMMFMVWLSLHAAVVITFSLKAAGLYVIQAEARSSVQGRIVDVLINHLSVRLFNKADHEREYVGTTQDDERRKHAKVLRFIELAKALLSVLSIAGMIVIFYTTIKIWQAGEISNGNVVFVLNSIINLMEIVWVCSDEMTFFFKEVGAIKQGLQVIQDPHENLENQGLPALEAQQGTIKFDNVTFNYRKNNNLFENKSVTIAGGSKVGLVGFSGSGKTTFSSLILRLYDIESGRILIDDQDIEKVDITSLRDQITLIPQEPMLFNRSVMDNIRYGRIDASDEEIITAAKQANCHDFIMKLEDGYETSVGEKGNKLSGGQRQRIAIARAFLRNSQIVIMDEATSALDSVTEKYIQDSFNKLTQDRTTLIIAHRLSTLQNVDRILVFDQGHIVEDGTHKDLLAKGGHYANIWQHQQDGMLVDGKSE